MNTRIQELGKGIDDFTYFVTKQDPTDFSANVQALKEKDDKIEKLRQNYPAGSPQI